MLYKFMSKLQNLLYLAIKLLLISQILIMEKMMLKIY